jgi:manganese/zinc/iron transport system permease protein
MTDLQSFLQIDLPAILAAVLACFSCALVGNYLVLQRLSLLGDAISHAILPGLVIAFLVSGERFGTVMLVGAVGAALVAGIGIEAVQRLGRLDGGAAMGVVFPVMFAAGLVLIEQARARTIHIDADAVLYGQLEDIVWLAPISWGSLVDPVVWADLPHEVVMLAVVALICLGVVLALYKELMIAGFDPALATTLGISAWRLHYGLVLLVSVVAVAAFEAVGSILVVAMLVCPAATARLLTDRLPIQLVLSSVLGMAAGVSGYVLAAFGPFWAGSDNSLSAAGMIAVIAGVLLMLAILFAPRYGVVRKYVLAAFSPPAR